MFDIILQVRFQGFGGSSGGAVSSATTYIIIGSVIGLIVLISVIVSISKRRGGGKEGQKFRKSSFKRAGKKTGLSDAHINILLNLIKQQDVKAPFKLLQNNNQLDSVLHESISGIEDSDLDEDTKEARKSVIYNIKQIIERNAKGKNNVGNTSVLKHGQGLVVIIEGKRYRSRVLKNLKDAVLIEAPMSNTGKALIVARWTRLDVQFWRKQGEMYSYQTKVTGVQTEDGRHNLLIQHSKNIEIAQQRRFRRIELSKPVYFGLVAIITSGRGRKQKKQAVIPNKRNSLGTLIDISSGGCSLKTNFPLKRGELIRMQFEIERRKSVITFGKVISSHKTRPGGAVMHIRFTKVTRKNLNDINALIYENVSGKE